MAFYLVIMGSFIDWQMGKVIFVFTPNFFILMLLLISGPLVVCTFDRSLFQLSYIIFNVLYPLIPLTTPMLTAVAELLDNSIDEVIF